MTTSSSTVCKPRSARGAGARTSRSVRAIAALLARPVTQQGALFLFDQAVVSATNFFTVWAVARACSPADLGAYSLAFTIVLFVGGIQQQAISVPYSVYCNRHRGEALASYTGSSLAHQLALSGVAVFGLLGLAGLLAVGLGPVYLTATVWVLLGTLPAFLLRDYLRNVTFAAIRPLVAVVMDVAVSVIQAGSLLLLWWFGTLSVPAVYAAIGAACAAGCAGWFLARWLPIRIVPSHALRQWRQNWTFARWTLASQLLGSCTPQLLPWILAAVHGVAAAGLLAACNTLVGLSYVFIAGMVNFLLPKAARAFARGGAAELASVLRPAAGVFLVVLGALFLAVAVSGDTLLLVVYGKYAGAGPVAALLALSILVTSLGVVAGGGLLAMERPAATFLADASGAAALLAAAACLVPPLGALGAAMANVVSMSVWSAIRVLTLLRLMRRAGGSPVAAESVEVCP